MAKKNTLVAVLGGCAQLMWLSSGCQNLYDIQSKGPRGDRGLRC